VRARNCGLRIADPAAARLVSCFFLLASLHLTGCEEKIKPSVANTGVGQDVPTQESWNTSITFTDSGRVTAIMHAGHIAVHSTEQYTSLDGGIKVDFFDEQEHHTSVLTADRGKVDDQTQDLQASGNVVVESDSGTILKTSELWWANAKQLIHTPAYVEITSPSEQIRGHGLESDQHLTNYRIFRVTGRSQAKE